MGRRLGVQLRSHASGLALVAIATVTGALASFVFQILAARGAGPENFGLISAFFAIVSVAAIGSSSLQSSVAVHTAEMSFSADSGVQPRRRWPAAALAIGLAGGIAVAIISPWLAVSLNTSPAVMLAAAACVPLVFLFADSLGLMQGKGDAVGAVWWSTISLLGRVVFTVLALLLGLQVGGIIAAVLIATVISVVGAAFAARRIPRPVTGVFSVSGMTVMVLTVAFAWLTNADVILMRAGAPELLTGNYASVTVLVKAAAILPATLSMYLLPRFVRNRDDKRLTRLGVLFTLGITAATGLAMAAFFAIAGDWVIDVVYGDKFQAGSELLVAVSFAYLPWIMAQGMLIRVTSFASKASAVVLLLSIPVQWIAFTTFIPDLPSMLTAFGIIGVFVLVSFLVISWLRSREKEPVSQKDLS